MQKHFTEVTKNFRFKFQKTAIKPGGLKAYENSKKTLEILFQNKIYLKN